ncbi:MAG: OmpA family protein [Desulfobacterales bacterium]|nr:OmpA family protein [Desulfobacterales bacterium]
MAKDKGGEEDFGPDPNAWMVTFGDLVMLLLTFFVLLLTMKSMDTKEYKKVFKQKQPTSGPLEYRDISGKFADIFASETFSRSVMISSNQRLEEAIDFLKSIESLEWQDELENLKYIIDVTDDERGVVISLEADNLFQPGNASITPDRLHTLDALGMLIKYASNDILIMGHTDNVPIRGGPFGSNWDLSVYRALSVLYYFTDSLGIDPGRLAAGGYGDMLPRFPNDTEGNRSKNRRVEFVLKRPH